MGREQQVGSNAKRFEDHGDDSNGEDCDGSVPVRREEGSAAALLVGASVGVERVICAAAVKAGVEIVLAAPGDDARAALVARRFDVVLISDERHAAAAKFAQLVGRLAPTAKTILIAKAMTVSSVVEAMRGGMIDVVELPIEQANFQSRLMSAIERSREEREREERMMRLKGICKKLNDARAEVSEQAKALSDDLRTAREEANGKLDEVAMTAEYRTLLRQELDLEDLLRVGVEYLIGKVGPTNAAVFLPGSDGEWSLGAYVNYDCPRTVVQPLLDRLASDVCPELSRMDELMRFEDSSDFVESLGLGTTTLASSQIVAWPCFAKDDCLSVFVLFRDAKRGFADELATVIDALRTVFAEQIATVLRVHHRATGGWPGEQAEDDRDEWDDRKAA
jgi:FixJ family two-component response regulator